MRLREVKQSVQSCKAPCFPERPPGRVWLREARWFTSLSLALWGLGMPGHRAWLLSILESLPLDLGTSVVKWGKAYDTVWVFIGPNLWRSSPSSGVMEKIKLPHSHVSAFRPFSFANRKCLFKYSSLQHVPEPSEKPKMSTLAPLNCSGHHLAVGAKRASACLWAGRGEWGLPPREFTCICLPFSRPRLWLEKNYICGLLLCSEG